MSATTSPQRINGIHLNVQQNGTGEPLVLVHGSWGSRDRWAFIEDDLARSFRVVTYDRRGHGSSDFGDPSSTRRDEEDDLAALIEALGIAPAHLAGSSYGGAIVLSLAARRPDLVRSVSAHEPPYTGIAPGDPRIQAVMAEMADVDAAIVRGEDEAAARRFVENVALGPGAWEMMPAEGQAAMIRHAAAFAREQRFPNWGPPDVDAITAPALVTAGDSSLDWFDPIIDALRAAPTIEVATIEGAGHIPHITHPAEYVDLLTRFANGAG